LIFESAKMNITSKGPKISILMPAFNAEKYIITAIRSILEQTEPDFELLITDDGSIDRTAEKILSFEDERIVFSSNTQNIGYLRTWNSLIAQAKGKYIAFQDADDWCDLDRLKKQSQFLDRFDQIGCCGCKLIRTDAVGRHVSETEYPATNSEIQSWLNDIDNKQMIPFVASGIMMRQEVYRKIGTYRQFFDRKGAEDYDYFLRVSEHFEMANVNSTVYYYRTHSDSVSRACYSIDNPVNYIARLTFFLYNQRLVTGTDSLFSNDYEVIDEFIKNEKSRIENDPIIYFEVLLKKLIEDLSFKSFCYGVLEMLRRVEKNRRLIKLTLSLIICLIRRLSIRMLGLRTFLAMKNRFLRIRMVLRNRGR